ncbi:MAG: glycine--tRNA ligase subunit beta [Candidatus Eisenbacteria bacterium]|nr:glycine--tRNA ligase subunit beta [Candidatus Eisenbacteria bacterium]
MARDLLFEIGAEEIPASYVPPALRQLEAAISDQLASARLIFDSLTSYSTPRRLAVVCKGVADRQARETRVVTGPPARIAFDEAGAPTKAATGFARSQGVDVSRLAVVGGYVQLEITDEGGAASDVLPVCLAAAADSLSFPKTMKWGPEKRFARPIRWLVALLGDDVLDFEYAGVRAGRSTMGLRFWSPGPHEISNPASYEGLLGDNYVMVDHAKRRELISTEADRVARECGGRLVHDEGLLDEVTFLVEYPTVYAGSFDERFLDLPRDVIVAAMKGHQRYFAVENDDGQLMPFFLCVVNGPRDHHAIIREGNERVLESRLDDAAFYWQEDTKTPLSEKVEELRSVVWLEGVGSLFEKTERLERLAAFVAAELAPDDVETAVRAARLAKADLVTEMVRDGKEFTELQGIMGREYAMASSEAPGVAVAIFEHYMPRFAGDSLPSSRAGTILSMVDKIDSIVGCFSVGLVPTGSQDPYALRRQAIGLVRMIDELHLSVSMGELVREAGRAFGVEGDRLDELSESVLDFIRQRARTLFIESGHAYDLVDAVLESSFDRLVGVRPRLAALTHFRAAEDFDGLVIGARRVANILKGQAPPTFDPKGLVEATSKALNDARAEASVRVDAATETGDFDAAVRELLRLRRPIDKFFDDVMVMVDDDDLKNARLGLLAEVRDLFLHVADFSRVVLEGEDRDERKR